MRSHHHSHRPTVEVLQKQFPHATAAECRRFHAACPKDAVKKLSSYLEWRKRHALDVEPVGDESFEGPTSSTASSATPENGTTTLSSDARDWRRAAKKAVVSSHHAAEKKPSVPKKRVFGRRQRTSETTSADDLSGGPYEDGADDEEPRIRIPQLVLLPRALPSSPSSAPTTNMEDTPAAAVGGMVYDLQGHGVALHLPARIDPKLTSNEAYSEAMALYLASKLDRHTEESMTLLVDVRPGENWHNPPALTLLGFIRQVSHALHDLNPHRLHRCIVFPVPVVALYIWKMIKSFLNPDLRELVHVLPGPSSIAAPPPASLQEFLSPQAIQEVEHARKLALKESSN